jgi:hypothetical protein
MLRRVMMAGASGPPPTASTFDPSLKGASIVLSNGNLDATKAGSGYQTVYTTQGRSSGRYAFEMIVTARPSASSILIGFADKTNSAGVLVTFLGNNSGPVETTGFNDNNGAGNSRLYRRMTAGNTNGTASPYAYTVGDIVTFDVNIGAGTFSVYMNGVLAGFTNTPLTSGKTYFPAASLQAGAAVRFIPVGLTYLPSGSTEWG